MCKLLILYRIIIIVVAVFICVYASLKGGKLSQIIFQERPLRTRSSCSLVVNPNVIFYVGKAKT